MRYLRPAESGAALNGFTVQVSLIFAVSGNALLKGLGLWISSTVFPIATVMLGVARTWTQVSESAHVLQTAFSQSVSWLHGRVCVVEQCDWLRHTSLSWQSLQNGRWQSESTWHACPAVCEQCWVSN